MKWKDLNKHINQIEIFRSKSVYEILNIHPESSIDEIKQSYRKLIKIYHPDVSDKFLSEYNQEVVKIINEAYKKILKEKNV